MDFDVLIADLNNSLQSLTKESTVGSNFNSLYCRKVSKAVDQIASNKDYTNVVTGLWCVAVNVAAHVDYLKPTRAFTQLCLKLFRQCAKVILNILWQNLEEDSSLRQNFLTSLENLHGKLVPLSIKQFQVLLNLVEDPWTHPTLAKIMGGETDDSCKEEVHSYIENEDPVILQLRVDMMLKENCEEFALNLCNSYLSHPKLQSNLSIRKTQLDLLYKLGQEDKLQEECQKLSIHDAVQVIKLLQTSRAHRKMCTVLTQTFMVQNWIRPSNVEASKELLKLWIGHQLVVDKEQDQFKESVWAVAKLSRATEQIALLIDVLREECGDSFLQLFVDMCIFAINVDKGQMEANRNEGNREAAAARRSDMASICDKLSSLCHHISLKVARISALTAFALKPTEQAFRKIGACYSQVSDQSEQSPNGKNQSPGEVNPATLYEVERLLNMLRPGYLNPDQLFVNIQISCQRYLQECLKQAEEFHKSLTSGGEAASQKDTSGESAISASSNMSTILAESLSSEDVQNLQQLLSRMRLLNIVHPKASVQYMDSSRPAVPLVAGSKRYDHTYQSTKHNPDNLEVDKNSDISGVKKELIKQQHEHNLIKEGDKIQQKDNRADEKFQIISASQPENANLTHQQLQVTKKLHEIIRAALEQDTATLLKLAQSSSPEMIQTAINIIKNKLPSSYGPVNEQQHKTTSLQINNAVPLPETHPAGSAQLQPSDNLQQRQPQLPVQQRQDRIRERSSQTQSSNLHLYNQSVITSVSNRIPHFQAARIQVSNGGTYLNASGLTAMGNGKQVTASSLVGHSMNQRTPSYTSPSNLKVADSGAPISVNSLVLHNMNQRTQSSSATPRILPQEKLKAESLLLARSCVGEVRHLLQSHMPDLQPKPIRETPQNSASTVTGVSNGCALSGTEFSSSSKFQAACESVKQATIGKIQENFSKNILYQIQQEISKQEQDGVTGRPYTLSIIQPQPLYHPQNANSKSNQQTFSNLVVPTLVGLNELNVVTGKPSVQSSSHSILHSLKPQLHGSVVRSVTNATHNPPSSSVVMIRQPKIISLSNLPDLPVQPTVIGVNKSPALYVTTCPVSYFNKMSQSALNNQQGNQSFTQQNFSKPNTVSQSSLNNKQPTPIYQNILPNLNSAGASCVNSKQSKPAAQNILPSMISQSSLNNKQPKPLYPNILPNFNPLAVSGLNYQQSGLAAQRILVSQSSLNNRQSKPSVQNTVPKLHTMTISSLNSLQTSPSVQHVITKANTAILSTLNTRQPEDSVQNICFSSSDEIMHSGQKFEIVLTDVESVRPRENITVLLQTDEAAKSYETVPYSKDIMYDKTASDSHGTDVSNNALYRCILCSVAFKTLDDLRHHVKYVCKPDQQSSSINNTKFKLNKASASNTGLEATTVFQCLRCLELCISEAGIKQHRLVCKKAPLKSSRVNKDNIDDKDKEELAVTVCYNSSSSGENDNCNNRLLQSEPKESIDKECNGKTGDSLGDGSVGTVSLDSSCQMTSSGQLEDNIEGNDNCENRSSQSELKESTDQEFNLKIGDTLGGHSVSTVPMDSSFQLMLSGQVEGRIDGNDNCKNQQFQRDLKESDQEFNDRFGGSLGGQSVSTDPVGSSCQLTLNGDPEASIDMQTGANVHDIELPRNVDSKPPGHHEPKSTSNQETANDMEMNTLLKNDSEEVFSKETVVASTLNQSKSKQQESSDSMDMFSKQDVNDTQVNHLINAESRIISRQQTLNNTQSGSLITESRFISGQQVANDVQTISEHSNSFPELASHSEIISGQQPVKNAQMSISLISESRIIANHKVVTGVQADTESSHGLHSSPDLTSDSSASAVPIKSNCASLPGPATSHSSKSPAVVTTGQELEKRNLVTFQPVCMSNSENLPPLSADLIDCLNIPQITVASVVTNTAYQVPLSAAFMNSSNVIAKENALFPLSKLGLSIGDVISNKNMLGKDNFIDASPFKNAEVLPGTARADLAQPYCGKFFICEACSKIVCSTSSLHLHREVCSMREKMAVKPKGLQRTVQKAKQVRGGVLNDLKRFIKNVTGNGGASKSKVVRVGVVKSSVVPMMQVCTDEVKKISAESANSSTEISIQRNNEGCGGHSQGDTQEFKTGVVAVDSGAGDTNTRDALVPADESLKIKEVIELKDGGLATTNLPETVDTADKFSHVQKEAHMFINSTEKVVESGKTKENGHEDETNHKEDNKNSRIEENSYNFSLFCKICQALYRSETNLLQHFVIKHLKPYTVKTSNSNINYVCHFCRNSFTTFKHYMQHVSHHSVVVYKKMQRFQSAKTSQNSHRNSLQQKLTQKYIVSRSITKAKKNRINALRFAPGRHLVPARTRVDRWRMSMRLNHSCVPADKYHSCNKSIRNVMEHSKDFSCDKSTHIVMEHGKDFSCNKFGHATMEHTSAVQTTCSSETRYLINNNIANCDESCCPMEKNTVCSPEHLRVNCHHKHQQDNQIVDETSGRSNKNIQDSLMTRRRRRHAVMKTNSQFSKRRRMSEFTEIDDRDQEYSTLEKEITSGQPVCCISSNLFDTRNVKSAAHQVFQGDTNLGHQVIHGEHPDCLDSGNPKLVEHQIIQGEHPDCSDNSNTNSAGHQLVHGDENPECSDSGNPKSVEHRVIQGENPDCLDSGNTGSAGHQLVQGDENPDWSANSNPKTVEHPVAQGDEDPDCSAKSNPKTVEHPVAPDDEDPDFSADSNPKTVKHPVTQGDENPDCSANSNPKTVEHTVAQRDKDPDCLDLINPKTMKHQVVQGKHANADLLENSNKATERRNNNSAILNQNHRKDLQPNGTHTKSVKTLLCSKDLKAASTCLIDAAIPADTLCLMKDTKLSATKFHADVTVIPSSYAAPKTVKPSFLDSYLSYISNYSVSGAASVRKKEK